MRTLGKLMKGKLKLLHHSHSTHTLKAGIEGKLIKLFGGTIYFADSRWSVAGFPRRILSK